MPAWNLDEVMSKKEVILEAQEEKNEVQFAAYGWTSVISKMVSVLQGDFVKDDSSAFVVFTE